MIATRHDLATRRWTLHGAWSWSCPATSGNQQHYEFHEFSPKALRTSVVLRGLPYGKQKSFELYERSRRWLVVLSWSSVERACISGWKCSLLSYVSHEKGVGRIERTSWRRSSTWQYMTRVGERKNVADQQDLERSSRPYRGEQ